MSDLDMEIQRVEDGLAAQFGLPPFEQIHPKDLMPMLQEDIATCEAESLQLQMQLEIAADLKTSRHG